MRTAIMALLCLLVMGGTAPAKDAAQDAPPGMVPLQVKDVLLVDDVPAVLLLDRPGQRYLLMFVDFLMATAIRTGMDGPQLERPLTHDLIGILVRRLGARFTRVTITRLKDSTYYALLSVQVNASGEVLDIDVRPSDAIAIAVRNHIPIFAAEGLLQPIQHGLPAPTPPAGGSPPKGQT
ncbi:MAG TPA: bifunctional nuclease family protein [bacterium]|nr:bifunctional nuclease family protein [bacterium]